MRTIPASETRLAYLPHRAVHTKVILSSVRGTAWEVELTDLESRNWVISVDVSSSMDDPVALCELKLIRNEFELSLAPQVTSKLNRVAGTAATLLQPRRRIEIKTQIAAESDRPYDAGTWTSIFKGEIFDVDPGAGDDPTITVRALDMAAQLKRFFNRKEQPPKNASANPNWYTALSWPLSLETFIQNAIDGCITDSNLGWVAATAYTVDSIRRPTTANRNGFCYRVTAVSGSGTSHATTEPTWPTYIGGTVIDNAGANQITWTCHYDELPTLYTPTPSGVNVEEPQDGSPLITQTDLDAMVRSWVMASAMDIRMRYDEGTSSWRFTLWDLSGDLGPTLSPSFYKVTGFRYSDADVRNLIGIPWTAKATPFARTVSYYSDDASRLQYGTQYFQLGEQDCVAIDTQAEADALGARILSDLSWPVATVEIELPYFPWLELGDTDVIPIGDTSSFKHPLWSDTEFYGTAVAIHHHIEAGSAVTTWTLNHAIDGDTRIFDDYWGKRDVRAAANNPATTNPYGKTNGPALTTTPAACIVDAHAASTQSIATDVWTKLNIDTIDRDLGADFAVGTYKFTAPMDGVYAVSASMEIGPLVASDLAAVGISSNGSTFVCQGEVTAAGGKTGGLQATCAGTTDLVAGQALYVYGYHDHGSNRTVSSGTVTRFSARRIA